MPFGRDAVTGDEALYRTVLAAARMERGRLLGIAKAMAQGYYDLYWENCRHPDARQRGRYMPVITALAGGVGVYWGEVQIRRRAGDFQVTTNKFGRHGEYRYEMNQFETAADWERGAIDALEGAFASIRLRTEALGRVVKLVKNQAIHEGHAVDALVMTPEQTGEEEDGDAPPGRTVAEHADAALVTSDVIIYRSALLAMSAEQRRLAGLANALAGEYAEEFQRRTSPGERGRYVPDVRSVDGGVCVWWDDVSGGHPGRRVGAADAYRYGGKDFAEALTWETSAINSVEPVFEAVRRRGTLLARITAMMLEAAEREGVNRRTLLVGIDLGALRNEVAR